jgi:hypothetical protein
MRATPKSLRRFAPRPGQAALVPPLPDSDEGDSAMNARHSSKMTRNFLQMQAFLQVRGYVNLSAAPGEPARANLCRGRRGNSAWAHIRRIA